MQTERIYGNRPISLGSVEFSVREHMNWLYLPVKVPGQSSIWIPYPSLEPLRLILDKIRVNVGNEEWLANYVYVTLKKGIVGPGSPGNRPGWHSDGFGTPDLNFIWYDMNPTLFFCTPLPFAVSTDDQQSLRDFEQVAQNDTYHLRWAARTLLRLDQTVVHSVDFLPTPGERTFLKVSVSREQYALEGNSRNDLLTRDWVYRRRGEGRNCPIRGVVA